MLKRVCILFLLLSYIAIVYWLTVFNRDYTESAGCEWRLFWTYGSIVDGRGELIGEVISNVLMFVPIGLLVGLVDKRKKWLLVLVIGVVLSLGIELLQLKLKRGLCETDDLFHNTVGCLLGFALIRLESMIFGKQSRI